MAVGLYGGLFALPFSSARPIALQAPPYVEPGVTPVRAVHFTELRARIDDVRVSNGLMPFTWTDDPLVAGTTAIRAIHMLQLRIALGGAYAAAGMAVPSYEDPGLGVGTPIRAVHINQLQELVLVLE